MNKTTVAQIGIGFVLGVIAGLIILKWVLQ